MRTDGDPKWVTQDHPGGVQVKPVDDLILHIDSSACTCCPKVEHRVVDRHWPMYARTITVHQAMDGRT